MNRPITGNEIESVILKLPQQTKIEDRWLSQVNFAITYVSNIKKKNYRGRNFPYSLYEDHSTPDISREKHHTKKKTAG